MKSFWRVAQSLLWLSVVASACGDTNPPGPPPSFERPNRVAFVCVDRLDSNVPRLADMACCTSSTRIGAPSTVAAAACRLPAAYRLHALVTQSSRGEVAAVDLGSQPLTVIDSRPDIPGPTFVPTGEIPVAIAVASHFPGKTYVANAGSRDISVLSTHGFLTTSVAGQQQTGRVLVQSGPNEPAGIPFDLLLSPDEDMLFVTSVQAGLLLGIPIKRCADGTDTCPEDGQLDLSAIVRVPLEESWAKFPTALAAASKGPEPYRFECSATPSSPFSQPMGQLPDPALEPGVPQPAGLALDAFCEAGAGCTRRLLIADKRQPIIHAVDIDLLKQGMLSEAVLPPIVSGAPTERVAVSPKVPVDTSANGSATQYVYAIDALDGSVLVAQDGVVREVSENPALRRDRLDLGGSLTSGLPVAISLAMLTPAFDVRGPADQWITLSPTAPAVIDPLLCFDPGHTGRLASRLRGVFLAVGETDGTVRIVNVHDMELRACRSCAVGQVSDWTTGRVGYDPFPVMRHQTRIGVTLAPSGTTQPVLAPQVTPQFQIGGSFIGVKTDGTTNDPRAAGLDCLECAGQEAVSFPPLDELTTPVDGGVASVASVDAGSDACRAGQGRVCSLADPFVDPLNWEAVYEGVIPGTRGGHGEVVDDATFETDVDYDPDFCTAGVLGDEDLPSGDQLQITSSLPSEALLATSLDPKEVELCNALVGARDQEGTPIAFRIRQAFGHRLVLNPQLIVSSRKQPTATLKQVSACFAGMPLTFQVHVRDSFLVQSSGNLGFQHHVVRQPDTGRCRNDSSKDARLTGRARAGVRFDNGLIAFQPSAGTYDPSATLRLIGLSNTPKLLLNASDLGASGLVRGVMPVDLGYSAVTETLYTIDITVRGLIPLTFDPMLGTVSYEYTVQ